MPIPEDQLALRAILYDLVSGATKPWAENQKTLNKITPKTLKDAGVYCNGFRMYEVEKLWTQFYLVYVAEIDPCYHLVHEKVQNNRNEQENELYQKLYPYVP